jgi:uncharacterized protein YdeI (YjbR/CyaY-like superfamily)
MKKERKEELAERLFPTAKAFETWLAKNHAKSPGLLLRIAKKGSGRKSVTYAEALEIALCYGWIDGQRSAKDEETFTQRFTPRTKRSLWSQINRDKTAALIAAGRMQEAGLREIERAKADGRWEAAYYGQKTATVPDDLAAALAASPKAKAFFEQLDSQNRYAILFRIGNVKRAETRARKIAGYVAMLERGEKIHVA